MEQHFRRADSEVPSIGGIRPKSVFQIGGAGAVGTGSLRGMPFLKQLRDNGFTIWPFDDARLPTVIEIYPRALTGPVNKGNTTDRAAYLESNHPDLKLWFHQLAASSEDAFDALVSALVMAEHVSELTTLAPVRDDLDRLEGRIWFPPPVLQQRAIPRRGNGLHRREKGDVIPSTANMKQMVEIESGRILRGRYV
jgi:hypothetical protein